MCPCESHTQSRHTGEEESKLTGHPSKMKLRTKDNIPSLQSHQASHEICCLEVEKDVQPNLGCLIIKSENSLFMVCSSDSIDDGSEQPQYYSLIDSRLSPRNSPINPNRALTSRNHSSITKDTPK